MDRCLRATFSVTLTPPGLPDQPFGVHGFRWACA